MMQIETRIVKPKNNRVAKDMPIIQPWLGVEKVVGSHILTTAIKEIVSDVKTLDAIKINLIGDPGTGKSHLAETLAHMIHKYSYEEYKIPFAVKIFGKKDLLNFRDTMEHLEPVNHILVFDDVSFLANKENAERLYDTKQAYTEIRHLKDGEEIKMDVKIVSIFNFHYGYGFDKYMRECNYGFFTNVGISSKEMIQKLLGGEMRFERKIKQFQKMQRKGRITGEFFYQLGKNGKGVKYFYRKPFIPVLFHNTAELKFLVSPERELIDPTCSICENSKHVPIQSEVNIEEFTKDLEYKFGVQIARNAVRIMLLKAGLDVYPRSVKRCEEYISRFFQYKKINFDDLMNHYKFKNSRIRLDEDLPDNAQGQLNTHIQKENQQINSIVDKIEEVGNELSNDMVKFRNP
jgi:hypothetical protein